MARKYVEDTIDAVYDYLVANLNTKLGTIRTERSSDYPVNYGLIVKRPSIKRVFPRIIIYKDNTAHNYSDEDAYPLKQPLLEHSLVISIEHMSGSIAEIDDTLMRYVEAINRITEDDDTYGNAFIWVQIRDEDWTPVFTNQKEKKSIQGVLIPITCKTI